MRKGKEVKAKGTQYTIVECFLLGMGALCILYYLVIALGHGIHISVMWIWLAAGILLLGWGKLLHHMRLKGRPLIKRRWMKGIFLVLFTLLMVYFVTVEALVISKIPAQAPSDLDYVIVLGASVYGTRPSPALQKRVNRAVVYLEENPNTKVIVSGGQGKGEDITEASCMARLLEEAGISEERILQEGTSTTTVENMQNSYAMIPETQAKIGIVTNNFHVFRAMVTARAQGDYEVWGIAAPFTGTLLPHYVVREFLAFTVDGLMGNL